MLDTLKKMILRKKDDSDLDSPRIERDYAPREDYRIPEPRDIRRLPNPGMQSPPTRSYAPEPRSPVPERPARMPPPAEEPPHMAEPRIPENNNVINQILYRLDNIERRLDRLEGYRPQPGPQPRRY